MRTAIRLAPVLLAVAAAALPAAVHAHRGWMLPSATVLSGHEPWVTVDAASSTDIFYPDHNAMQVDDVVVIGLDGTKLHVEYAAKGRFRSVFDVKLVQKGTHKIALVTDTLFASYKLGAETKRLRGTAATLAKELPAGAEDVRVTQFERRIEVFVTSGKPTTKVLEPTGRGLELVPLTHPNDLVAGEAAKFRFLLDGKPAAGINVQVIPHGIRYRDKLDDMRLVTDAGGEVSIKWAAPGMYWLNASPAGQRQDDDDAPPGAEKGMGKAQGKGPEKSAGKGAEKGRSGPAGTVDKPARRTSYTTTLEVMSQ